MNSTQNVGVLTNLDHILLWSLQKIKHSQRVDSDQTFFAFFAILFSGMFVAAALGGFAFQPSTFEGMALIGIVGAVGSYAAARVAWKSFAQKRYRDLQRLLDTLTAFAEGAKDYDEVAQ